MSGLDILAWCSLIVLTILGIAGTIIPGLPGIALVLLGAIFHKVILPEYLSWTVIACLGVLSLLTLMAEIVAFFIGAKWGGASKKGVAGAAIGSLLGLPLGFFGLIVGPMLGAFAGEVWNLKSMDQAVRAGLFTGLGLGISVILRLGLVLIAVLILIVDLFV